MSDRFSMNDVMDRLDALTERVDKMEEDVHRLMSNAIINGKFAAPKPEGVYVREGMRVHWGEDGFTVREQDKELVRGYENHINLWHDDGSNGCIERHYLTYKGKPVLGYEEDRP